ncbi:MAG: hypothetical protein HGA66_05340 [Holophaga sp.]|nr:hypothetical protein [Holophaga sp.]
MVLPYLAQGGTEGQVLQLVRRIDQGKFVPFIVALGGGGGLEREYRAPAYPKTATGTSRAAALMGLSSNRGPSRWTPLGRRGQVLQYPGPEADLKGGMDRLDPASLLPHLERLRGPA